jgi:glycosyltransferase involved in cell wall biosynthesis
LELLLETARQLQGVPAIRFVLVGAGPVKSTLTTLAQQMGLANVLFHPEVARECMPAFFSMAQVAVVPLRKLDLFQGALPTKMFDAWACACPTLVTIAGEAKLLLTQAAAGLWVEPENPAALAEAILTLYREPAQLRPMGENGRRFVSAGYARQTHVQQLEKLLGQVLASG